MLEGARLVYYTAPNGDMWSAEVELRDAAFVRDRRLLFENTGYQFIGEDGYSVAYDVSPRDGRFLMIREEPRERPEEASIDFVLRWDLLLGERLARAAK